ALEIGAGGVARDRANHAGSQIGEDAKLERDSMLSEIVDERWVLDGARPVSDAIDAQLPQGPPHAFGPGGLAGVRRGAEAERACTLVDGSEGLGWIQVLRAADTHADHPGLVANFADLIERRVCPLGTEIPDEIRDERHLDLRHLVETPADGPRDFPGSQSAA